MAKVKLRVGARTIALDPVFAKLAKKSLTSVEVLEPLVDVEVLDISHNQITSLANLPRLLKLHTLHAYGNPLRDLRGIERLPALHTLYTDAATPAGIAKAASVKTLVLTSKRVTDLRCFAGMKSLSYLGLHAPLKSFAGLDKLPGLGELVVSGGRLGSLAPIKHASLWKLIVQECELENVPDLKTPKLELALFGDNAVTDLGRIDAPALRELDVSSNPLTHLGGLEKLSALESLTIDGRKLKTIAKATDALLRARGESLQLRIAAKNGAATYAAFAATKTIV